MTSNSYDAPGGRSRERAGAITRKRDRRLVIRLAGTLVAVSVCAAIAACDTRSNKDLNGIATWPMGGPAHGAWQDPQPATAGYGSSETTTTTTTTTVRPISR
jgi:hypothetical protein